MVQRTVRTYVYMAPRWTIGSKDGVWSHDGQCVTQSGMRPRDAACLVASARAAFPQLGKHEAVARLLADHPALLVPERFVVHQAKKAQTEEAKVWRREEARQLEEQKREEARVFEESGGAAGLRARLGECPINPPTAGEVARQRAEAQRLARLHDEEAAAAMERRVERERKAEEMARAKATMRDCRTSAITPKATMHCRATAITPKATMHCRATAARNCAAQAAAQGLTEEQARAKAIKRRKSGR